MACCPHGPPRTQTESEQIARENAHLASKSLSKQRLEAYPRVLEHRPGKIRRHRFVPDLFHKLKLAGASFSRPADLTKH
jgi:hypothetical protein